MSNRSETGGVSLKHADEVQASYEQALSLLCGLHPCITIDGPPLTVAERIFDHVQADQRASRERIASLGQTIESLRRHLTRC